jgi:hypothetical protein
MPVYPGWDRVSGRSVIPRDEMAVVIQGYDSYWPCFTNDLDDFRVLYNDGLRFLEDMIGRDFVEFSFANSQIVDGHFHISGYPGPYHYEFPPGSLLKSQWFPKGQWTAAMDHVGLDHSYDDSPALPPLVPRPPYAGRVFLNWHAVYTDPSPDLPSEWWGSSRSTVRDMYNGGVFYFDDCPPTAEFTKLRVGPSRKGMIPLTFELRLADKGSPWVGIAFRVTHGKKWTHITHGAVVPGDLEVPPTLSTDEYSGWTIRVAGDKSAGKYSIRWVATDVAGNKASGSAKPFIVKSADIDPRLR